MAFREHHNITGYVFHLAFLHTGWNEEWKGISSDALILVLLWRQTVGIINKLKEGGREGNEASWITLCPPRSNDDPPCNLNHFHLASQGSKELVNITSWPCVSLSQLHFQLRAEEKREPSVHSVKKQEDGWEVGWCMKNIIGEKRTEVVNSLAPALFWCVHCRQWMSFRENSYSWRERIKWATFSIPIYTGPLPWLHKAYTFWLLK